MSKIQPRRPQPGRDIASDDEHSEESSGSSVASSPSRQSGRYAAVRRQPQRSLSLNERSQNRSPVAACNDECSESSPSEKRRRGRSFERAAPSQACPESLADSVARSMSRAVALPGRPVYRPSPSLATGAPVPPPHRKEAKSQTTRESEFDTLRCFLCQ